MADSSSHPWDGISDELTSWIDEESSWYVDALKAGHRSPFAAPLSEQEKRVYYLPKVFTENPDGSINYDAPNEQGRQELLHLLGVKGYTQVVADLMKKQGRQDIPIEPATTPAVPTDQMDQGLG